MEISLILSLRHEEEDQNEVGAGHDGHKPMIPSPALVLNQKPADRRRQRAAEAEPDGLNAGLSASFMEEEDVVQSSDTQRLAGTG